MESSHLVILSRSGKFITKFNVLRCCIIQSETLFWTGVRGRIPVTSLLDFLSPLILQKMKKDNRELKQTDQPANFHSEGLKA